MNELFEFRKHLNTKKVIGIAVLILVIILLIVFLFSGNKKNKIKKENDANPYRTYTSLDSKVSLELPKRYNLHEIESNNILSLQSNDGLLVNIEEEIIVLGKSLKEIADSDKYLYLKKFENTFDVSNLEEFSLENNNLLTSYKYSFKHTNEVAEYFIQVFWIQGNTKYYIINICMPQNDITKYQGIESEIISSFKFI